MKKALTILLSVMITLCIGATSVFAEEDPPADPTMGTWDGSTTTADETNNNGTGAKGDSFDATATVTKDTGTVDDTVVYCVDIAWTMTPAAYTSEGDTYKWDPATLTYKKDVTNDKLTAVEGSENASVSITVTNKSNADVKYEITYASAQQDSTDISEATQTTTDKESGKLTSAASGVTPTLTGSPETTSETGTATSDTYKATVKLLKTEGDNPEYIATQAAAGDLVLGTYTVSIKKLNKYNVKFKIDGNGTKTAGAQNEMYYIDNDNELVKLDDYYDDEDRWYSKEIEGEYLAFVLNGISVINIQSVDGTGFTIENPEEIDEDISAALSDLPPLIESGDSGTYLMKLTGDAEITVTGYWDD